MKKIAVGLSGGVDSCTAAYLLLEQGYEVMGITLRLKQGSLADADIADARRIAEALGIELERIFQREDNRAFRRRIPRRKDSEPLHRVQRDY